MAIRLIITACLVGMIGVEREMKDQSAGLRTHLLVGVGSCMMMLLSIYGFKEYTDNYAIDVSRLPSYVISGIGFLGAGTILKDENKIRGLTTAASIWVCSGIGLVIGSGLYFLGTITTLIVFISLYALKKIQKHTKL